MGTSAGAERTRQFNFIENIVLRKEIKRLNRLISLRKLWFLLLDIESGAGDFLRPETPPCRKPCSAQGFGASQIRLISLRKTRFW